MTRRDLVCIMSALVLGLGGAGAIAQQTAPPLIAQSVADTRAHKTAFAFDVTTETANRSWRAHFEPSRSGQKLRLVAPQQLNAEQQRSFNNTATKMRDVGWCANEEIARAQDFRILRDDADAVTYSFRPSPQNADDSARRMANQLRGEMIVSKTAPDISNIHVMSVGAFSPFPLVTIDAIDITMRCVPAPNGRRYAAETVSDVRGRAFGRAFAEHAVQRVANLTN